MTAEFTTITELVAAVAASNSTYTDCSVAHTRYARHAIPLTGSRHCTLRLRAGDAVLAYTGDVTIADIQALEATRRVSFNDTPPRGKAALQSAHEYEDIYCTTRDLLRHRGRVVSITDAEALSLEDLDDLTFGHDAPPPAPPADDYQEPAAVSFERKMRYGD